MLYNIGKFLCCITFALLATSCNAYRSNFDCPPGRGVPCTSVTEIESMIVETKEGPDIFTGSEDARTPSWAAIVTSCARNPERKVWIQEAESPCGNRISGHYVYIQTVVETN